MRAPDLPSNEEDRLEILNGLGVLYSPAEERFDRITRLAKRIFNVPIALVSLVSANTQWFKSCQGLDASETSREVSFCGHAILGGDTFVVPDATKDPDFADNPLVTGAPHIRFYAGHPVQMNSVNLGTLCLIDRRPRKLKPGDFDTLRSLAAWTEVELKLALYSDSQRELMQKLDVMQRRDRIDPITGCWNKRAMDELSTNEVSRAQRTHSLLGMMLIEAGVAKKSKQPASVGDRNLFYKEMAQRIRSSIRPYDVLGRMAESTFLVVLPDCTKESARTLAKRVLRNTSIGRVNLGGYFVSAGVFVGATTNEDTKTWSGTLLEDAARTAIEMARRSPKTNNYAVWLPSDR